MLLTPFGMSVTLSTFMQGGPGGGDQKKGGPGGGDQKKVSRKVPPFIPALPGQTLDIDVDSICLWGAVFILTSLVLCLATCMCTKKTDALVTLQGGPGGGDQKKGGPEGGDQKKVSPAHISSLPAC